MSEWKESYKLSAYSSWSLSVKVIASTPAADVNGSATIRW